LGRVDVLFCGIKLVFVDQQNGHKNGGVWIVDSFNG